jgi:hypothetical protein
MALVDLQSLQYDCHPQSKIRPASKINNVTVHS